MILGCIADDLTGATDLALTLTREGLRTIQCAGVPDGDVALGDAEALVVALKSRSVPAADAVAQSVAAARALIALGARRLMFKYCSTFDSTDAGNIGPVAGALRDLVGAGVVTVCPAFPRAGRTVYAGHLFVDGVPLHESALRHHPLNPMRDSDLRRVLGRQTRLAVGHVGYADVDAGPERIAAALDREAGAGRPLCVVDALDDAHLRSIGVAVADHPLVTGGSGIATGLPAAYLAAGLVRRLVPPPTRLEAPIGRAAVLSGSCSAATREQVRVAVEGGLPSLRLDATRVAAGEQSAASALAWADRHAGDAPLLIYSSADPEEVSRVQAALGREAAGALMEALLGQVARGLIDRGVRRFLVAGGETSGAVAQALGVRALTIGPEIAPGVPWTRTVGEPDLALALKSGNFGGVDIFLSAWRLLS